MLTPPGRERRPFFARFGARPASRREIDSSLPVLDLVRHGGADHLHCLMPPDIHIPADMAAVHDFYRRLAGTIGYRIRYYTTSSSIQCTPGSARPAVMNRKVVVRTKFHPTGFLLSEFHR
eukprot:COSAG02_NODE_32152_length_521_cov_0.976303_1_plen_119_part_10